MASANGNPDQPGTGDSSPKRPDNYQSERALKRLAMLLALGPIAIVIYLLPGSHGLSQFFMALGVGIAVAAAALLVGGLLGFLFGIPRTLQQSGPLKRPNAKPNAADPQTPADDDAESTAYDSAGRDYEANTNLEQISDWLTKILVGVGLTQVRAIAEKFSLLGGEVASALGSPNGNKAFALSLIIFNLIIGFLFSYLWTRLYLPGAFREADRQSLTMRLTQMGKALSSSIELGVGKLPLAASLRSVRSEAASQIQPGSEADPWKGQFGGLSENNGRRLTAKVNPLPGRPDFFGVLLTVESVDPKNKPLSGEVQFFLHPTFKNDQPTVKVGPKGKADLNLVAWGAFTVGALADEGNTKLELDLSELDSAPLEFRSR